MSLDGMRRHQIGHGMRVWREPRPVHTYGLRSWAEVARLYREWSGETICDRTIRDVGLAALAKVRNALAGDPLVQEAVGLRSDRDRARGDGGADPGSSEVPSPEVLLLARRAPGGVVTARMVRQRVFRFRDDPGGARDALEALVAAGYGRWQRTRRGVGRPSDLFILDARHRLGPGEE